MSPAEQRYAGYTVPLFYETMIAIFIVQGRDRPEAVERMRLALDTLVLQGVTTTMPFLSKLMQDPHFKAGDVHTKFLEQEGAGLLKGE